MLQKSSADWYSLGENGWNTLGENAWYIMGRKMTPGGRETMVRETLRAQFAGSRRSEDLRLVKLDPVGLRTRPRFAVGSSVFEAEDLGFELGDPRVGPLEAVGLLGQHGLQANHEGGQFIISWSERRTHKKEYERTDTKYSEV